jgi:hypothetical protein
MRKILAIFSFVLVYNAVSAQVLISLILGDKLNSDKIEFGLDGGANFSDMPGVEGASSTSGLFLGFYFDIKTKSAWYVHTGVIVKSPLGAAGIKPYSLNDPNLDNAFAGGEVHRALRYFNVPFAMKRVFKNHLYADAGIQLGLLYKAFDEFSQKINEPEDLNYKVSIKNQFHPLDAGLVAGLGYRLMKGNGMNISAHYYLGLVDITIDDTGADTHNRCLYVGVGIPIGAGKAKARAKEKSEGTE